MWIRHDIFITSQELSETNTTHLPKKYYLTPRASVTYINFLRIYNDYDGDRGSGFNAFGEKNPVQMCIV